MARPWQNTSAVAPVLRAIQGCPAALPPAVGVRADFDWPKPDRRREFLRAVSDCGAVRLAGSQDSSALSALAAADSLIDRPAHAPAVPAGEPVRVFPLQNG